MNSLFTTKWKVCRVHQLEFLSFKVWKRTLCECVLCMHVERSLSSQVFDPAGGLIICVRCVGKRLAGLEKPYFMNIEMCYSRLKSDLPFFQTIQFNRVPQLYIFAFAIRFACSIMRILYSTNALIEKMLSVRISWDLSLAAYVGCVQLG